MVDEAPSTDSCRPKSDMIENVGLSLDMLQRLQPNITKTSPAISPLCDDLTTVKSALEEISAYVKEVSLVERLHLQLYLDLDTVLRGCQRLAALVYRQTSCLGAHRLSSDALRDGSAPIREEKLWGNIELNVCRLVVALKTNINVFKHTLVSDQVHNEDLLQEAIHREESCTCGDPLKLNAIARLSMRIQRDQSAYSAKTYQGALLAATERITRVLLSKSQLSAIIDRQIELDRKLLRKDCNIIFFGNPRACDILWNQIYFKYTSLAPNVTLTLKIKLCKQVLVNIETLLRILRDHTATNSSSFPCLSEIGSAIAAVHGLESKCAVHFLPYEFTIMVKNIWASVSIDKSTGGLDDILGRNTTLRENITRSFNLVDILASPEWQLDTSDIRMVSLLRRVGENMYKVKHGTLVLEFIHPSIGQGERRKWINQYENVHLFIFVVDAPDYHHEELSDYEGPFPASVSSFESITQSRWFSKTDAILVLFNADSLGKELLKFPLAQDPYCSDYSGGSDVAKATKYIIDKHKQAAKPQRNIRTMVCQRYDEVFEKLLLDAARESLIRRGTAAWTSDDVLL